MYSIPLTTGIIGIPAFAYSSFLLIARAQKCGGVQIKINSTSKSGNGSMEPTTAVQPSKGGIAPAKPPMTIFCEPENLSTFV